MALELCRVLVLDDSASIRPVDDVVVRFYHPEDGQLVASATTGEGEEPGTVAIFLEGDEPPTEYVVRFYRPGARIPPRRIAVYSPASVAPSESNDFEVTAELFTLAPATDPMMCRVSGLVIGSSGLPMRGTDISIQPKFHAFVDRARAAVSGRFIVRTDKDGFVSFDLYRFGHYEISIEGQEYVARDVAVPNRASILFGYLLFPIVVQVAYAEAQPFEVEAGARLELTPTIYTTDYRSIGVGHGDVLYSVADPTVASVQLLSDRIIIYGLKPGTTHLRVTRADRSIVYLPDPGITGGSVLLRVV